MRQPLAALVVALAVTACRDVISPPPVVTPPVGQPGRGLMEITFTGIGGSRPAASARALAPGQPAAAPSTVSKGFNASVRCLTCPGDLVPIAEGDGTIQLDLVSSSSFTTGVRGAGGYRYVSATFRVRNAPATGGTGYTTPRTNLQFVAVNQTTGTLAGTNISQLYRFDGSPATPAIAAQMIPTGLASLNTASQLVSSGPDVLQVFTEEEVAVLGTLPGVVSVLPYGFVVRETPAGSARTLAANPEATEFGGIVTFAYRYPLQATAAEDPFTISGRFLAVDNDQARITQSAEELVGGGKPAFLARVSALGASPRALFATIGGDPSTMVCRVRSAGTAGTPTAFVANLVTGSYGVTVTGSTLERDGRFSVFSTFPFGAPDHTNIVINSFQSGRAFVSQPYVGAGTTTVRTPDGNYRAGEEIEATFVPGGQARPFDAFCPSHASSIRFPVASAGATAEFAGAAFGGLPAQHLITGDVNGDGNLDLITISGADVQIAAGDGSGGLGSWTAVPTGVSPIGTSAVGLGDVNGDGHVDIVAAVSGYLVSLLNNGAGVFTARRTYFFFDNPSEVRMSDWNRDGKLDVAVGNACCSILIMIFNGDGAGGFTVGPAIAGPASGAGTSVAWSDFDGGSGFDIVAPSGNGHTITYALSNTIQFGTAVDMPTTSFARVARAGDVVPDGYRDIVAGTDGGLSIYPSSFGTFGAEVPVAIGAVADVAIADADGDNDLDIFAIVDDDVRVFLNNGSGTFAESPASPVLADAVGAGDHIAIGDYNNDGSVDIAVTDGADTQVHVLLNTNFFNVVDADATNNTTVVVTFDAAPDPATGNNAANYAISGGLTVNAAVVSGSTVTLTTAPQGDGTNYTLTVSASVTRASDGRPLDVGGPVNFFGEGVDYSGLVINEVYIGNGTTADKHEFVELFNGTGVELDFGNLPFALILIAPGGTFTVPVVTLVTAGVIPVNGYMLLASDESDANDGWFAHRDGTFAGGLESNGAVAIQIGSDIDILGWGSPAYVEGIAPADIPAGSSLERVTPGVDTGNNFVDFQLNATPTPRGTVDPPES